MKILTLQEWLLENENPRIRLETLSKLNNFDSKDEAHYQKWKKYCEDKDKLDDFYKLSPYIIFLNYLISVNKSKNYNLHMFMYEARRVPAYVSYLQKEGAKFEICVNSDSDAFFIEMEDNLIKPEVSFQVFMCLTNGDKYSNKKYGKSIDRAMKKLLTDHFSLDDYKVYIDCMNNKYQNPEDLNTEKRGKISSSNFNI
jgi:hypothetical protein